MSGAGSFGRLWTSTWVLGVGHDVRRPHLLSVSVKLHPPDEHKKHLGQPPVFGNPGRGLVLGAGRAGTVGSGASVGTGVVGWGAVGVGAAVALGDGSVGDAVSSAVGRNDGLVGGDGEAVGSAVVLGLIDGDR